MQTYNGCKLTEDQKMEILLVCGHVPPKNSPQSADAYWTEVFIWIKKRWPNVLGGKGYHSVDPGDIEVLSEYFNWCRSGVITNQGPHHEH